LTDAYFPFPPVPFSVTPARHDKHKTQHYAIKYKKWAVINALVEAGHNMNDPDNQGNTPMLWLSAEGKECLDILLSHGADINAPDKNGLTLLYWVVTTQRVRL
jgi:ankyrin repeat protein